MSTGGWRVERMTNTLMRHGWIVVNPACPTGRHPTRGGACGCRVFRDHQAALDYAISRAGAGVA